MAVDPSWVLSLMLQVQPKAPWLNTYKASAEAISKAAQKYPLFVGEDGERKTAALLVSLGFFEGALKPDAKGDCKEKFSNGLCKPGSRPQSYCMFQIHETNHEGLGVTKEDLLNNIDLCTETAVKLLKRSFQICSSVPVEEKLRWYAGGGDVCTSDNDAIKKSKHRILKAIWLFNKLK